MKIYDVTIAVSETVPTFPGDPKVKIDYAARLPKAMSPTFPSSVSERTPERTLTHQIILFKERGTLAVWIYINWLEIVWSLYWAKAKCQLNQNTLKI